MKGRVLIVDDDSSMCRLLDGALHKMGLETQTRDSADAALEALMREPFDAVVADVRMRGRTGLQLCSQLARDRPGLPVIVITAFGSMEMAIDAIRAGAYDFVTKPFDLDTIRHSVRRAVEHGLLRSKVARLERSLRQTQRRGELIGRSPPMLALYDVIARVANTSAAVLISGESGTGKELVARALHDRSHRSAGPFVAVNCAAVPASLLESELFGHTRGAFTDARTDRAGLFVAADGGTLLLDEISELPLELQPKLLRALQDRRVRPVGGNAEQPFDARLVTATNRNLYDAVGAGRFREDLYYRIQVIQLEVPALRERGNDILLLAQHFVEHFAILCQKRATHITTPAAQRLLEYPWPGNVRELCNCMEYAVTLAQHSAITVEDLPPRVVGRAESAPPRLPAAELVPLDELERTHILRVLGAAGGNKSLAAKILGVNRKTLHRKLRRYGIAAAPDEPRLAPRSDS